MRVKPLVWKHYEDERQDGGSYSTSTPLDHRYWLTTPRHESSRGFGQWVGSLGFGGSHVAEWDTLEQAQAACQADYEQIVLSMLELP